MASNKILVVIPARGGSKGIPGKNIKLFNGKPLITYAIESAQKIFPTKSICISSDDDKILEVAKKSDVEIYFKRPSSLARDTSGTRGVLLHAIEFFEKKGYDHEVLILLQPTSPFRTYKHIEEALNLYRPELDMVVSVKESKGNPYYNLYEEERGYLKKSKKGTFIRRQDVPKVYEYNGAIYIININALKKAEMSTFNKVKKFEMDELSSMDLDTPFDWKLCELIDQNFTYEDCKGNS